MKLKSLLRPVRQVFARKHQVTDVVRDLDAIISEPVFFKLHGKVREIRPISTAGYLKYVNSLAALYELKDKQTVSADELIDRYFELVSAVCDDFTREDIEEMGQQQIGALFQLILDTISGKSQVEAEKKTLLMNQKA